MWLFAGSTDKKPSGTSSRALIGEDMRIEHRTFIFVTVRPPCSHTLLQLYSNEIISPDCSCILRGALSFRSTMRKGSANSGDIHPQAKLLVHMSSRCLFATVGDIFLCEPHEYPNTNLASSAPGRWIVLGLKVGSLKSGTPATMCRPKDRTYYHYVSFSLATYFNLT